MKNRMNETHQVGKNIGLLQTAVLATLSKRALLVLMLCLLAIPQVWGGGVTTAIDTTTVTDSTVVSGPKKSHWTSKGWFDATIYNDKIDYAQAKAIVKVFDSEGYDITNTVTDGAASVGTVSIANASESGTHDGTVEEAASVYGPAAEAYINWNCGLEDKLIGSYESNELIAAHKLKVKLEATLVNTGYKFLGWSKKVNSTAQPTRDDISTQENPLKEVNQIGSGAGYESYGSDPKNQYESKESRYTVIYYALFAPSSSITITLADAVNGSYTCTYENTNGETVTAIDGNDISTEKEFALEADAAENYKFFGWYTIGSDDKENYFSYEKSVTGVTFAVDTEVYAKFIPADQAVYIVKGEPTVQYYDFQVAEAAAESSTSKVFLPIVDGTVPYKEGGYTIRSGVTLLIPYDDANTVSTNKPNFDESNSPAAPSPYRTLTLASGVNITVEGNLCVNAFLCAKMHYNGAQNGKCGMINMNEKSTITVDGSLYCWGVIYGAGEITANSGSTIYESFQINDYSGGTFLSTNLDNLKNNNVFPIKKYCMPNIQSKLHINYGATEKLATAFASFGLQTDITFVSSSAGLFVLDNEAVFTKWYDVENDRQKFQVSGNASIQNVSFKVGITIAGLISYDKTINSADFVMPLTHNIDIEVRSGTTTVEENISLLPGGRVFVCEEAIIDIESENYAHIYDVDNWEDEYAFSRTANNSVVYGRTKKMSYAKVNLADAKLDVNGTINVYGALYTTTGGADICSSKGTGKVVLYANAPGDGTAYQVVQENKELKSLETIDITPAQLHNDEGMNPTYLYTPTEESEAGYEFWYVKSLGMWVKNEFGPELDIVDANSKDKTLTINANGWASSGWPYTVSVVTSTTTKTNSYKKTDRQSDRTLKVPYSGDLNADMQIIVTNTSGTVSNHIYKVPYVYTGDVTMSGTDENSIVFVKSGTLSIEKGTTASAKEIYVAPGAELNVTGTLTVGKLVLRTTPWQAAVLTNSGTINGQVYYSRIAPNKSKIKDLQNTEIEYNSARYYQFGLPLSCDIEDVTMSNTGKFGASNTPYGNTWLLKSYNEESRANTGISNEGANWVALESAGTITAGVGYEMFSNSNYYREFYFPVTLPATATTTVNVSYTSNGTKGSAHAGWNIVCSPLTGNTTVSIGTDPATAIKPCWLLADGSYTQGIPEIIPPAVPFAYQASAPGTLNFAVSTAAAAPRRQSAAEAATETEWVHLDINNAEGRGDETSIFVHPTRFEQTYKIGIDVAKQSLTASRAILYSAHAYGYMAFAGVADTLLEKGIDLIVYSPAEQELTISLRENAFLNRLEYLWLIDNKTGARTDLLLNNYTFRATEGTAEGRLVISGRFKAPQISTSLDNTSTGYNIYTIGNTITIGGVEPGTPVLMFDAVGHVLFHTTATTNEVSMPAVCAGVYMLYIGGQTHKMVIGQ